MSGAKRFSLRFGKDGWSAAVKDDAGCEAEDDWGTRLSRASAGSMLSGWMGFGGQERGRQTQVLLHMIERAMRCLLVKSLKRVFAQAGSWLPKGNRRDHFPDLGMYAA